MSRQAAERPRAIFLHVATIGNYQLVLDEVLAAVVDSGAIESCVFVEVEVVGTGPLHIDRPDARIHVVRRTPDVLEFEHPTLTALYNYAVANPGARVLYLNCLGGRHTGGEWAIRCQWRKLLYYVLLQRADACVALLDSYDTCSVQWALQPMPHFTSNNWWANADYLIRLGPPALAVERVRATDLSRFGARWSDDEIKRRHSGEFWIGLREDTKPYSILDLASFGFPRSEYGAVPWWRLEGVDWHRLAQRALGDRPFGVWDLRMRAHAGRLMARQLLNGLRPLALRLLRRKRPTAPTPPTQHRH